VRRLAIAASSLIALTAACSEDPTQVLVYVTADEGALVDAASLSVRACAMADAPACVGGYERARGLDEAPLPARIPVGPPSSDELRFALIAQLLDASDGPLSTIRAEAGFVPGETREIRIHFSASCNAVSCPDGQTCVDGGSCVDACFAPEPAGGGSGAPSVPVPCPDATDGGVDTGPTDTGPTDTGPDAPPCECECPSDTCVGGRCVPSVAVERVSGGWEHTCASASGDAGVYCFGENTYGQLGIGRDAVGMSMAVPTHVTLAAPVVDLSAGERSTCVALSNGELYCWGNNNQARLGLSGVTTVPEPTQVGTELSDAIDWARVRLVITHGCALTTRGEGYCWGRGVEAQLGQGMVLPDPVNTPTRVPGVLFDDLAVGIDHSCGLATTGTGFCWGDNRDGQAGEPIATNPVLEPTRLPSRRYVSLSLHRRRGCAISAEGELYCWGDNGSRRLGLADDTLGSNVATPSVVAGENRYRVVSLGQEHQCAVGDGGELYCWGFNVNGQLGVGDTGLRQAPERVGTDADWATVGAGRLHTCAVKSDGRLYCWGRGLAGQLGESCGRDDRIAPCRVCFP
jgi:hypothetical protein